MSSNIWTRDALLSSAHRLRGQFWRMVEAQSQVSTMKLTDSLDEQEVLENIIEESKPIVPEECRHLDYLLLTPFRYTPYPFNSRFRRAGSSEGVFYASEASETAAAEAAFYRLLFFAESPDTPWPENPGEYTAFAVDIATPKAIDLMHEPFVKDRPLWTDLGDYTACLDLADTARSAALEAIRYESVRDLQSRANVAILSCRAFAANDVVGRQTWHLHFGGSGVRATCESPKLAIPFARGAFAADPRMASFRWNR